MASLASVPARSVAIEIQNWLSDGDFITNEEHRVSAAA